VVMLDSVWQKAELMANVLLVTVDGETHTYCDGFARSSIKPQLSTLVPAIVQLESWRSSGTGQVEDDTMVASLQRIPRMPPGISRLSVSSNMMLFP
jgi:hypothetical protein